MEGRLQGWRLGIVTRGGKCDKWMGDRGWCVANTAGVCKEDKHLTGGVKTHCHSAMPGVCWPETCLYMCDAFLAEAEGQGSASCTGLH